MLTLKQILKVNRMNSQYPKTSQSELNDNYIPLSKKDNGKGIYLSFDYETDKETGDVRVVVKRTGYSRKKETYRR